MIFTRVHGLLQNTKQAPVEVEKNQKRWELTLNDVDFDRSRYDWWLDKSHCQMTDEWPASTGNWFRMGLNGQIEELELVRPQYFFGLHQIIYINLDHRADRRRQINETITQLKGNSVIRTWLHAHKRKPGALGCLLSHIQALAFVHQYPERRIMIMEDDIESYVSGSEWGTAFRELKEYWPGDTWDVLVLAPCVHSWSNITKEGKTLTWKRVWHSTSGGCYIVNPRYVSKLLDRYISLVNLVMNKDEFDHTDHFDQVQTEFQKQDVWLTYHKIMLGQRKGPSDLTGRTDHNSWQISDDGQQWQNGDGIAGFLENKPDIDWSNCHTIY